MSFRGSWYADLVVKRRKTQETAIKTPLKAPLTIENDHLVTFSLWQ